MQHRRRSEQFARTSNLHPFGRLPKPYQTFEMCGDAPVANFGFELYGRQCGQERQEDHPLIGDFLSTSRFLIAGGLEPKQPHEEVRPYDFIKVDNSNLILSPVEQSTRLLTCGDN